MACRHGRCPASACLVATVPHGHWYITTFVAGLRQHGVTALLVLDGPMTGAAFRAYCFMPNTRRSLRGDEAERNSGKAVDTAVLDSGATNRKDEGQRQDRQIRLRRP
jgi:hypothetical protein